VNPEEFVALMGDALPVNLLLAKIVAGVMPVLDFTSEKLAERKSLTGSAC
jgi:hypothetical protein